MVKGKRHFEAVVSLLITASLGFWAAFNAPENADTVCRIMEFNY
jgi:hypothetical protein